MRRIKMKIDDLRSKQKIGMEDDKRKRENKMLKQNKIVTLEKLVDDYNLECMRAELQGEELITKSIMRDIKHFLINSELEYEHHAQTFTISGVGIKLSSKGEQLRIQNSEGNDRVYNIILEGLHDDFGYINQMINFNNELVSTEGQAFLNFIKKSDLTTLNAIENAIEKSMISVKKARAAISEMDAAKYSKYANCQNSDDTYESIKEIIERDF